MGEIQCATVFIDGFHSATLAEMCSFKQPYDLKYVRQCNHIIKNWWFAHFCNVLNSIRIPRSFNPYRMTSICLCVPHFVRMPAIYIFSHVVKSPFVSRSRSAQSLNYVNHLIASHFPFSISKSYYTRVY